MNLHEYTLRTKGASRSTFYIATIGDVHYGAAGFDKKKFLEMVAWIKARKNVYWVGVGDYIEAITRHDAKRFQASNIDPEFRLGDLEDIVEKEIDGFVKMIRPIAKRCIGMSYGNHEFAYLRDHDRKIVEVIAGQLKVPNLGWTSLTRLKFMRGNGTKRSCARRVLTMLLEHSNVSGRKKGGKINRLEERINDWHNVDIIIWGHSHDKAATTKTQLYLPTNGKLQLKARKVVCMICPSFYKTYALGTMSYGERVGYSPTTPGMALIEISPFVGADGRVEMHVSI